MFASSENWRKDERNRLCETPETWFICFLCGISLAFWLQFYHRVSARAIVTFSAFCSWLLHASSNPFPTARVLPVTNTLFGNQVGSVSSICLQLPHLLVHQRSDCLGKECPTGCSVHYRRKKNMGMFCRDKCSSLCRKKWISAKKVVIIVFLLNQPAQQFFLCSWFWTWSVW